MGVRFLPARPPKEVANDYQREDLAEVIDLRARILGNEEVIAEEHTQMHSDGDFSLRIHDIGIKKIASKAMSKKEVYDFLVSEEFPDWEAESFVEWCDLNLYLNDLDLARFVVEKLQRSGAPSKGHIARKLKERKIPEEIITLVLEDISEESDEEALVETARKRAFSLRNLDRTVAERRLVGYLSRRGWGMSAAVKATKDALDYVTQA